MRSAACVLVLVLLAGPRVAMLGVDSGEEEDRVCWVDTDCVRYPLCRLRVLACRCQPWGMCLLLRSYGQRCAEDVQCADAMVCNSTERVCNCDEGSRFSRPLNRCVSVPQLLKDLPRFADLPDLDRTDSDFPSIPATYVGPYLVGFISLGLVFGCLTMALWCRFTNPNLPSPESPAPPHPEPEKIPLDLFYLPPPEMYQTPGYFNLMAVDEEAPSTSQSQLSLGVMGVDLSRSLR